MTRLSFVATLVTLMSAACGDDLATPDGGTDASGRDGTTARDVGSDSVGSDARPDGTSDGGTGMGPITGCMTTTLQVDPSWTDQLEVEDVTWCTSPGENQPLSEVMESHARVWIAPGTYAYPPRENGSGEMTLPVCAENKDGAIGASSATGSYMVTGDEFGATLTHSLAFEGGDTLVLNGFSDSEDWPGAALDPSAAPVNVIFGSLLWLDFAGQPLAPCGGLESWTSYRFGVTLAGGDEISVNFRGLAGSVSTGPSGGFVATGTIGGAAIEVSDHYRIAYSPAHHHFGGAFAVLFDEPIREACGIQFAVGAEAEAAFINCDLSDRETLVVESSIREPE